ncbi:MAG: hypothetical protein LBD51_08270 [Bifidobacteriaceae bacterium]|jgi:hypothetical protein|nr:hypothetical protein [Bifidobacteriaceae bacterium]
MGAAAFLATLALAMMVVAHASYAGRASRDAARAPVFNQSEDNPQVAWFHWRTEESGLTPIEVFAFEAIDRSAPPPPGIGHWPEPGEVFVSPALAAMPAAQDFVARYGLVAGAIAPEALADPGERLAYVGREGMSEDRAFPISGFGQGVTGSETGYFGTALYQQREMNVLVGLIVFALAPGLLFCASATRADIERRQRRLTVLRVLGAPPSTVRRAVLAQVLAPVLLGSGAATALSWLAAAGTWPVPLLHFYVVGDDLRHWIWLTLLAGAAVVATCSAMAVFWHRQAGSRVTGTRPQPAVKAAARWPAVFVVCLICAANGFYYYFYDRDPAIGAMLTCACAGSSLAFITGATALPLRGLANAVHRAAKRRGSASGVLVGRELQTMSRPALRASVAVSAAAILAVQVLVWCTVAGRQYREAVTAIEANSGVTLLATSVPDDALPAVAERLAPESVLLALAGEGDVIVATCDAAELVIGDCARSSLGRAEVTQIGLWVDGSARLVVVPSVADYLGAGASALLVVSTDGSLDQAKVARAFNDEVGTPVGLEWPAGGDAVGGVIAKDQGRWFYAGGAWALLTVLAMGGFGLAIELDRLARRFAPLSVFVDRRSTFAAIAFGTGGLPLLASGTMGLAVGWLLVFAPIHLPDSGASLSSKSVWLMAGLTAAAGATVGAWCWMTMSRRATNSNPVRVEWRRDSYESAALEPD